MTITRLLFREIFSRKGLFLSACLTLVIVCLVANFTRLAFMIYDQKTEAGIRIRSQELEKQMHEMEDEYRKITLRMGFNVYIFPKQEDKIDFFANDYAQFYMPESYANRLAESNIVTVNHLLPILQQKWKWPEHERTILLIGTKGQIPLSHGGKVTPLMQPVPDGKIVLGYELHKSLGYREGDTATIAGRSFIVHKTLPEKGTKDDITLWMPLKSAQELLDKKDLINGIMALQCNCGMGDIGRVREEIVKILPDTQIIEFSGQALARAEARARATEDAKKVLEHWNENRTTHRKEQGKLSLIILSCVLIGGIAIITFLTYQNVNERRIELSILKALGTRTTQLAALLLGKVALTGILGSLGGTVIALIILQNMDPSGFQTISQSLLTQITIQSLIVTPVCACLAAAIPILRGLRQDPADVLREQ